MRTRVDRGEKSEEKWAEEDWESSLRGRRRQAENL
jgi:hypothetical protein